MWEWIEMMRKLSLSVVGAAWPSESTMGVATAMLISIAFFGLHCHYYPFRSMACNRLQSTCQTSLSAVYFIGILLKTDTIDAKDREDLGIFMVFLLACVFVNFVVLTAMEVYTATRWISMVTHQFSISYEGKVTQAKDVPCICSFPGKFESEWNDVVRLGKCSEVSVSCVFLPQHTPTFGTHVTDDETGRCFCWTLYGEQKLWGCAWFEQWKDNCLRAHVLKQRFQVFYFPGQVGKGKVKWDQIAEHALLRERVMKACPKDDAGWPKKMSSDEERSYQSGLSEKERHCVSGLGGSQKAEVAWLDKHGIEYEELDVADFTTQYSSVFAESLTKTTKARKGKSRLNRKPTGDPHLAEPEEPAWNRETKTDVGLFPLEITADNGMHSNPMHLHTQDTEPEVDFPSEMAVAATDVQHNNPMHSHAQPEVDFPSEMAVTTDMQHTNPMFAHAHDGGADIKL
jgi:hypothetical protein